MEREKHLTPHDQWDFHVVLKNNIIFTFFPLMQNDKLELLKSGSLQHLGENMLAFLLQIAASSHLPKGNATEEEGSTGQNNAIYFDILVYIHNCKIL